MGKIPIIAPLDVSKLRRGNAYSVIITTIGYERRARNIAERFRPSSDLKYALGFKEQQVYSYQENRSWFAREGFTVQDVTEIEFAQYIRAICENMDLTAKTATKDNKRSTVTMLVDISSMTRSRLATIVEVLSSEVLESPFAVDFLYTVAQYNRPPSEAPLNSHVGPVTPAFAGWSTEPDRGVAAIVGLGYEQDKALGAVEHVQAADIWTYAPSSPIAKYTPALAKANKTLLDTVAMDHQLFYQVGDPLNLYAGLESLVHGLFRERNVILFPFGPKIFALCSLLVACTHSEAAVWRVSAEGSEIATDRQASDFVFGLKVCFPASFQ